MKKILILSLCTLGLLCAETENAFAYTLPNGVYYISPKPSSKFRIDNDGGRAANGNNIHLWEHNGKPNQKWRVENVNGGIVIRSMNNQNFVIDNSNNNCANTNNIQLYEYNGTNAQLWIPEKVGPNLYVLRNATNRNYVIDWGGELRNFGVVHLYQFYPNFDNQIFRFTPVKENSYQPQAKAPAGTVTYNIYNGYMKLENKYPNRVNVNYEIIGYDNNNRSTVVKAGHVVIDARRSVNVSFNNHYGNCVRFSAKISVVIL